MTNKIVMEFEQEAAAFKRKAKDKNTSPINRQICAWLALLSLSHAQRVQKSLPWPQRYRGKGIYEMTCAEHKEYLKHCRETYG